MKSVCFLYNWFKPAYKAGGPIQSLVNLAEQLETCCELKIICSNKDADGTLLPVKSNQWINLSGKKIYYSRRGFWSYWQAIRTVSPDVLFINGIYSVQFNILPILLLKGRKILSIRGMLHPGALSEKRLKKKIFLRGLKLLNLASRCEFHATSEDERRYIESIFGKKSKIWVAPNVPREISFQKMRLKEKGELVLATVALISPMKNHLAVLKALRNYRERLEYRIYGPVKDEGYWNACREVINTLPENVTVVYYGDIPTEDVPRVLKEIHVIIQPSKSENFGHSLYEALASGHPVITSLNTPWNELKANMAGRNIDPEDEKMIIEAIRFFWDMDYEELLRWSMASRKFASEKIEVEKWKRQYMMMFDCG